MLSSKRQKIISHFAILVVGLVLGIYATKVYDDSNYNISGPKVSALIEGNAKGIVYGVFCGVNQYGESFTTGNLYGTNLGVVKIGISFDFGRQKGYPTYTYVDSNDAGVDAPFSLVNPAPGSGFGSVGQSPTDCRITVDRSYSHHL